MMTIFPKKNHLTMLKFGLMLITTLALWISISHNILSIPSCSDFKQFHFVTGIMWFGPVLSKIQSKNPHFHTLMVTSTCHTNNNFCADISPDVFDESGWMVHRKLTPTVYVKSFSSVEISPIQRPMCESQSGHLFLTKWIHKYRKNILYESDIGWISPDNSPLILG